MDVLQLGPYPPPEGGIHRNMLAIREELQQNSHQCSIIVTSKTSEIRPDPNVYYPRTPIALIKLLINLKYDILHVHIGGTIPLRIIAFLAICAIFGRGKSILTLHSGGYVDENLTTANYFSRDAFVFRMFQQIICVSTSMVEMFEKFGVKKEKLHLIYPFTLQNPDQTIEVPPQLKDFGKTHQPFLLTVCLLEDTYDLFMQIEAMEKVLEIFPNAGLLIAGSGSLEFALKKAILEKHCHNHILLAGNVEHSVTLHLINQCDILLRTTKFDGDAISIREALHLETPVIATDNKMRPAGVHLIPIGDVNALVKHIEILANIEKKTKVFKEPSSDNIKQVLQLYKKIAN